MALPLAAFAQPAAATPAAPGTGAESPAPRIGVVTMQPGTVFFERFGHDAIVVVDPLSGEATSYNFGYFDPSEDDFISRFARGDMRSEEHTSELQSQSNLVCRLLLVKKKKKI